MDPPGSITWIHQDQSLESTRIHCTAPLGPITWIYQNPSPGSTRIHHVNPPGCIIYGSSRIHHLNPTGSIMWIQWDPSRGSTRIHHMDPTGSITLIHRDLLRGSTRIYHSDPTGSITSRFSMRKPRTIYPYITPTVGGFNLYVTTFVFFSGYLGCFIFKNCTLHLN